MSLSRRSFVGRSSKLLAATSAAGIIPGRIFTKGFGESRYTHLTGAEHAGHLADSQVFDQLVLRAVDAGKAAGADFVDARVIRSVAQSGNANGWNDAESIQIGVRAFVKGVWGFASSPYCDLEEATLLAQSAVFQAKANSDIFPNVMDLGSYPVVRGFWTTPIKIDPFTIPMEERSDYLGAFSNIAPRNVNGRNYRTNLGFAGFSRTEKTIATSAGSLYRQTYYIAGGDFNLRVDATDFNGESSVDISVKVPRNSAEGWERLPGLKARESLPELIDEAERSLFIPSIPVNVGRYEVVMTAEVAAGLVAATLGASTQLDMILGYHANDIGTSYLGPDFMNYLGKAIGSESLTVTADRDMEKGLATTKWDDEGVTPEPFTIIDNGRLVDLQTSRDTVEHLSEWYSMNNRSTRSNGCTNAPHAYHPSLIHTPNLTLHGSGNGGSFEQMVANTKSGIAVLGAGMNPDFQSLTVTGSAVLREIRNGKLGAYISGGSLMFNSLEIWKTLLEVGGSKYSSVSTGMNSKGQPGQNNYFTIKAVPIRLKDMAITDFKRGR